jgi:hypothetical protein
MNFFAPCKTRSAPFESSWLRTFVLHKVEVFDIMLGNSIKNPKENKNPKILYLHSSKNNSGSTMLCTISEDMECGMWNVGCEMWGDV